MSVRRKIGAPAPSRYGAKDFFGYGMLISDLAPGNSAPGSFTVDAAFDFLWIKGTMIAFDDAGAPYDPMGFNGIPNLTIVITDTGSGRNMMNIPLPVAGLFGTGPLPFILPTSKLFKARATVSANVVNNDAAVTFSSIYLNFLGTQAFLN